MIRTVDDLNFYDWQKYVAQNLTRYNVIIASRQHGKTTFVCEVMNSVVHSPLIKHPLINLCSDKASRLFPIYSQRLNELFDGLGPWRYNKADIPSSLVARQDGSLALINFIGSIAKPTGCTGTPAHLNVIDECDLVSEDFIFKSAMPATDKTEGITICTGTWGPRIAKLYAHAFNEMINGNPFWFAFKLDFGDEWSKQVHTPEALKAIRARYNLKNPKHKKIFDTEYLNRGDYTEFEKNPYYLGVTLAESQGRVKNFNLVPNYPVNLAWDDGRGVTAIWAFQYVGDTVYLFDYFEWKAGNLPTIAKNRLLWYGNNGFAPGVQVVAHTMKEQSYELSSGASRLSILKSIFKKRATYCMNPKIGNVANKFTMGNTLLPKCVFHSRLLDGQDQGIDKLKTYARASTKTVGGSEIYQDKVAKTPSSHAGDAFTEIAMAILSGRFQVCHEQARIPTFNTSVPMPKSILNPY